jgi:GT2 family glycosyltransferase
MSGERPNAPVYAIVVNYNGWRDTIECVESLLHSDYPALRVIVCDNASTDGSLARIRAWAEGSERMDVAHSALRSLSSPPVAKPVAFAAWTREVFERSEVEAGDAKVLLIDCQSNLGFAGANNVGLRFVLRRAEKSYVLLFNSDAVAASDAVRAMVATAERSADIGGVGATVLQYHAPDRVETLGGARLSRIHGMTTMVNGGASRDAARPESPAIDYVTGSCLLVPRQALARVGLMDERYFLYGEDSDWGLRMTNAGFRLAYCPEAEVWHKGGASVVHKSVVHDYYDVRGRLMLIHKHFPMMLPIALVHSFLRCILPKVVRGEWNRLGAAARGYRDFLAQARGKAPEVPATRAA